MNTVDIYPEEPLIIGKCYGDVRMADIYKLTEMMLSNPDFSPAFNGVVDFRGVNLLIKKEDVIKFSKSAVEDDITRGIWCYICDKPMTTAFMTVFKNQMESMHPVEVFNTIAAASRRMHVDLGKYLNPDL